MSPALRLTVEGFALFESVDRNDRSIEVVERIPSNNTKRGSL